MTVLTLKRVDGFAPILICWRVAFSGVRYRVMSVTHFVGGGGPNIPRLIHGSPQLFPNLRNTTFGVKYG